jgi:Holliday junction resolvasome RuvABC DNA-binding subunit
MVELREKMVPFAGRDAGKAPAAGLSTEKENISDAIQGMIALGCKQPVAEKAIRAAVEQLGEDAKTEDLLREGLKWR